MTNSSIEKSIFLQAAPDVVWDYLTQPELLAKWFHAPKEPLAEGKPLKMYGTTSGDLLIWGDVLEARKPERLTYTFTVGPMGDAVSTVKWTLTAVAGGTKLQLEHEGLPEHAEGFGLLLALDAGWDKHLGQMRDDLHQTAE